MKKSDKVKDLIFLIAVILMIIGIIVCISIVNYKKQYPIVSMKGLKEDVVRMDKKNAVTNEVSANDQF